MDIHLFIWNTDFLKTKCECCLPPGSLPWFLQPKMATSCSKVLELCPLFTSCVRIRLCCCNKGCVCAVSCSVAQLCLTLLRPHGHSPPGSAVQGILQARILEWVAISSSRGSSRPRDRTHISCIGRQILNHWATWEAPYQTPCPSYRGLWTRGAVVSFRW